MLEVLQKKVEGVAEDYTDLIKTQIMQVKKTTGNDGSDVRVDSNSMETIYEGIRTLNHVASVLERIDRIQRRNACGQGQDVTLKQDEFNTMLQEYSKSPSNVKFGLDNAIIKLNNEDGTMRPVLDVISELKVFYETSFEMGTVIHLKKDDISETEAESTDVQKLQQKILWEVDVANDGVLQIHPPTNSNYISIHGADELWFLICRLMDCIQLE